MGMSDAAMLPGTPHQADNGIEHDQRALIDFLADPVTHGGVECVERFEMHGNLVFLAGTEAFKIKRAVRFDYMDFSTLGKRRVACLHEVEVNQHCGGDLYLGCVPIRRSSSGQLSFSGNGEIVEWAVKMQRFDRADRFSTLAERGKVDAALAARLAISVYICHQTALRITPTSGITSFHDLGTSIVARSQYPTCSARPTTAVLLPASTYSSIERQAFPTNTPAAASCVAATAICIWPTSCFGVGNRPSTTPSNSMKHWPRSTPFMISHFCLWTSNFGTSDRRPISCSTNTCVAAARTRTCAAWLG
jgi:hypothetical protein